MLKHTLPFGCLLLSTILAPLNAGVSQPPRKEWVPHELVVSFKASPGGAENQARAALLRKINARSLEINDFINSERLLIPDGSSVTQTAEELIRSGQVKFAHPNYIYEAQAIGPSDPLIGAQWAYPMIHADEAYDAWKAGSLVFASNIVVGVVDTGVSAGHPDLDGKVLSGWDFVNNDPNADDDDGHGTHVASIIAANVDNLIGMAGIAFTNVTILPVKVLNYNGTGTDFQVANGITYAVNHGARVINLSLGAAWDSGNIYTACFLAYSRQCIIVAAAGNYAMYGNPLFYPAAYSQVISVGALDQNNSWSTFSSFGKVDIAAPGGAGTGTCYASCVAVTPSCYATEIVGACRVGGYSAGAGTSFASPMVAAAVALLLAQNPNRGFSEIERLLIQTADPTALGPGYNKKTGWGRVNVYKALRGEEHSTSPNPGELRFYAWPNPFQPDTQFATHLTFFLDDLAPVKISIYDQGGDKVQEFDVSEAQEHRGMNVVEWDCKNGYGDKVASGAYMMVLRKGPVKVIKYLAVLR